MVGRSRVCPLPGNRSVHESEDCSAWSWASQLVQKETQPHREAGNADDRYPAENSQRHPLSPPPTVPGLPLRAKSRRHRGDLVASPGAYFPDAARAPDRSGPHAGIFFPF
jgi:hypothetical protein